MVWTKPLTPGAYYPFSGFRKPRTPTAKPLGTAYVAAVLADSPGAYWHMGESTGIMADSTGHGNGLSMAGSGPWVRGQPGLPPNYRDGCMQFGGQSMAGTGGTSPTTDLGDVWTIEAWIARTTFGNAGAETILSKPNGGYNMRIAGAGNQLSMLCAGTAVLATSTVAITDTAPHHCVCTKNGASGHIYIDGTDVTGAYTDHTCVNTAYWLSVGNDNGAAPAISMFIDEVAIYPTALSPARVLAHYNAGMTPP